MYLRFHIAGRNASFWETWLETFQWLRKVANAREKKEDDDYDDVEEKPTSKQIRNRDLTIIRHLLFHCAATEANLAFHSSGTVFLCQLLLKKDLKSGHHEPQLFALPLTYA